MLETFFITVFECTISSPSMLLLYMPDLKLKKLYFVSLVTIDVNYSYGNIKIARGSPAAGGTNKEYHIIQSWDITVVKPDDMLKQ